MNSNLSMQFSDNSFESKAQALFDFINVPGQVNSFQESFIFDYFENKKLNVMKVGYRFKFQTEDKSLTDKEVDALMKVLTDNALSINGVNIEGL